MAMSTLKLSDQEGSPNALTPYQKQMRSFRAALNSKIANKAKRDIIKECEDGKFLHVENGAFSENPDIVQLKYLFDTQLMSPGTTQRNFQSIVLQMFNGHVLPGGRKMTIDDILKVRR